MKNLFTPLFLIISCTLFSIHAKATVVMIEVKDFEFEPDEDVNVNVGDTIQWFWTEGSHTTTSTNIPVEATAWDAVISSTSQTFQYVVTFPGNYDYVCTPHAPGMAGNFIVTGGTNIPVTATAGDLDFEWYVAGNELLINVSSSSSNQVEVKLMDFKGQMLKKLAQVSSNENNNFSFDTGNLSKGIYLVEIISGEGRVTRQIALQ